MNEMQEAEKGQEEIREKELIKLREQLREKEEEAAMFKGQWQEKMATLEQKILDAEKDRRVWDELLADQEEDSQ